MLVRHRTYSQQRNILGMFLRQVRLLFSFFTKSFHSIAQLVDLDEIPPTHELPAALTLTINTFLSFTSI